MELSERIKQRRKALRLSAEAASTIVGVSKDNWYKWEKGSQPSNPEDYKRLLQWLNEGQDTEILSGKTLSEFMQLVEEKQVSYAAAIKVLTLEVLQLKHLTTGGSLSALSLELERLMQQEGKRLLDELRQ